MSDERSPEQTTVRNVEREERRLARLRLVVELPRDTEPFDEQLDDFDPDPKQAA